MDKTVNIAPLFKIKVKLDENAKMPQKAHSSDAGYDLFAPYDFDVPAADIYPTNRPLYITDGDVVGFQPTQNARIGSAVIDTGVHMQIPFGYVGMIKSKSGLNAKHGLIAEGVVDSDYTGSIVVKIYNLSNEDYHFKKGDKITQIVVMPTPQTDLVEVSELDETERGYGGFGSSGR